MSNDRNAELRKVVESFAEALQGNQPRPTTGQSKTDQRTLALLQILQLGDIPDKWLAARQLGQFGNQLALVALESLTRHSNQDLAQAAGEAIAKIKQRISAIEAPPPRREVPAPPPPPQALPSRPQPGAAPVPAQPLQPISHTSAPAPPHQEQSSGQATQKPQATPNAPVIQQPEVKNVATHAGPAPLPPLAALPEPIVSIPEMAPLPNTLTSMPDMAEIPGRMSATVPA